MSISLIAKLYKPQDSEHYQAVIERVEPEEDGWVVSTEFGSLWVQDKAGAGFVPEVGMTMRCYGKRWGEVRGIDINGITFRYKTPEEQQEEWKHQQEESDNRRKREFQEKRAEYEATYQSLPAVFQQRIDRFRRNNPDFNWRHLPYELFVCEEAVKIFTAFFHLDDAKLIDEQIHAFHELPYEEQKVAVPNLDYDNHSGNTFGCACFLARLYAQEPELVASAHGALCPLVGCRDYGCFSAEECDAQEKEAATP